MVVLGDDMFGRPASTSPSSPSSVSSDDVMSDNDDERPDDDGRPGDDGRQGDVALSGSVSEVSHRMVSSSCLFFCKIDGNALENVCEMN